MYQKFEQLDKEKRLKIINAGYKEFGFNGYDKGSTNKIVKDAGISKGAIFHYFGSKENFYFYLFDYTTEFILGELNDVVDHSLTDILDIYNEYMEKKVKILEDYPMVFGFVTSYMVEQNQEIYDKVWAKLNELRYGTNEIFQNVDYSLFRDELDIEMTIYTIMSTMEKISLDGFSKEDDSYDIDGTVSKIRAFIDFCRVAFYK